MKLVLDVRKLSHNFFACLILFLCVQNQVQAAPIGPKIVFGDVVIDKKDSNIHIRASDKAIIDWDAFQIAKDETVTITLPDDSCSVLHRVRGDSSSEILGQLTSNGCVYLINQKGLDVKQEGNIHCASFVSSTLEIQDEEFQKSGPYFFQGDSVNSIKNFGKIECEKGIALLASSIENWNLIRSKSEEVCLAASQGVLISTEGDTKSFFFKWEDLSTKVENYGLIEANQIAIEASSVDQDSIAILNKGSIFTNQDSFEKGRIFMNANGGTLLNENIIRAQSGKVTLTGTMVALSKTALVDVSGPKGEGIIAIGGGWNGKDEEIPNADFIQVANGAKIIADANAQGNGGDVIVWADKINKFEGFISSKGVGKKAKGGKAEVSCKETLLFDGRCDLSSLEGSQGDLLLDPASITVQAASPNIDGLNLGNDITTANELALATTFPGVASIITSGAINSLLTGGVSMTLSADNFITVNSPIAASGVVTALVLNAPQINLNQPITLPFGGVISGTGTTVNVGASGVIQNAIDAAAPGATVNIATGTYVEEVNIPKDVTLNGNGQANTIIQCPTTPNPLTNTFVYTINGATYHPFVMAEGASSINIQNLTIDGNSQASNFLSYRFCGIGYHNAGGTIQNVHATNVEDSFPGGPTQHGLAIFGAIDTGAFTINVLNCLVDRFQKGGISMRGPTLTTQISGNTVTGETPSSTANANGIIIQDNAVATISNNNVSNLLSVTPGNSAVAIFLFGAGGNSSVIGNTASNSNIGIYAQDTSGLTTITSNILSNNTDVNMALIDSASNDQFQLGFNQFINGPLGLVVEGNGPMGPVVSMNHDSFTGTTGYYIEEIAAPNDIWPTTATVSFDGLVSGQISFAQFEMLLTKIYDKHNDPALGLVLDFIPPQPPPPPPPPPPGVKPYPPCKFEGELERRHPCNTHKCHEHKFKLHSKWSKSPSKDVVAYNVYKGQKLLKVVPSDDKLKFKKHLHSHDPKKKYKVRAVGPTGLESKATKLKIED